MLELLHERSAGYNSLQVKVDNAAGKDLSVSHEAEARLRDIVLTIPKETVEND